MTKKIPRIVLAINYVNYSDVKKKNWQKVSMDVLVKNSLANVQLVTFNYKDDEVHVPQQFMVFKMLERNSQKTIGNTRPLPYVKDIFDFSSQMNCDVFGYLNSDIMVHKEFFDVFDNYKKIDAYLFSRTDIADVNVGSFNDKNFHVVWKEHPGFDGIFFRRKWWLINRKRFNDNLVLGEPEWDYYYDKIIRQSTGQIIKKRKLYHVHHDTIWNLTSTGAVNNRKINGAVA